MNSTALAPLKLPRKIENTPEQIALENLLKQNQKPIWSGSSNCVTHIPFTPKLEKVLHRALTLHHLERGLETIEQVLIKEKKGLQALQEKQNSPAAHRISRILLFTQDGAERFYRACERTLLLNSDRLLGLALDVSSEELGLRLLGPGKPVKALLVNDRDPVTQVLLSLL